MIIVNEEKNFLSNKTFVGIIGKTEFLKFIKEDKIIGKDNTVVISIHDPDSEFHSKDIMSGFNDSIQVKFWDVTEKREDKDIIDNETAKKIKEFILKHKKRKFLVHCSAGISRSAGTGLAIENIIHYQSNEYYFATSYSAIKEHPRYKPNLTVYKKIMEQ